MQRTRCLALLAVLKTVSFISAAGTACVCPEQCDCLQEGTIDCANRRLLSIPAAINCTWPNVTTMQVNIECLAVNSHAMKRLVCG